MPHPSTPPLRVQIQPLCESAILEIACTEVGALGLDVVPSAVASRPGLAPPDLRILLIDGRAVTLRDHPIAAQHPECPVFVFLQSRVDAVGTAPRSLDADRLGTFASATIVGYDAPADLRWKLGQTLAGFLSARFREAQRRQSALLTDDAGDGQQALLRFAAHRDARLRQLALRLAVAIAERRPETAQSLARQLAASNRTAAFPVAALLVRTLARRDGRLASALLGEMCLASPAFRHWALARLTS